MPSSGNVARALTVAVGIAVMGVGLYSHFQSSWVKSIAAIPGLIDVKLYKFCEGRDIKDCPHISLEQFYVSVIIVTFLISLAGLILANLIDMRNGCIKLFDVGYHVIAMVALFLAAAAYIYSAEKIEGLKMPVDKEKLGFKRTEKLIAGGLTIFQGVLYGITASVLGRS